MKKLLLVFVFFAAVLPLRAWWDPGHMLTALIAYQYLNDKAKARVDELTRVLQRDYPQVNHFVATGPWPDDLKADGVRGYDTWHYTNLPLNPSRIALPAQPEVDIIWAINESVSVLKAPRAKEIEKARFLAFLVHFVSDLHQPLHSTSVYDDTNPSGNAGGNEFLLTGNWRNLHALWDDGCGYLSPLNDIRPFGQPKAPITEEQIARLRQVADTLIQEFPWEKQKGLDQLDPDFWVLESHKLAVSYGYRGQTGVDDKGRPVYLQPGGTPSDMYLQNAQKVVRKQLAVSGYRLAALLNQVFGDGR